MRLGYRLQQFGRQFQRKPLTASAWAEVAAVLSEAERGLFTRLDARDQWHSYRVFCTLRAAGQTRPALLKAALLHDVGKTRVPLTIFERALIVVVGFLLPRWVAKWGAGGAEEQRSGGEAAMVGGWRRPFLVKQQHAEWGAQMAEAVGSQPLVVALIRRHQDGLATLPDSLEDELLAQLQWADDQN
jgi:putative nucleotidyltransferase with HDIG domain